MKKNIFTVFIAFYVVLSATAAATCRAESSVTCNIGEWPPYTSEKNDSEKIAERIVAETLKLMGQSYSVTYAPWKRAYHSVKTGKANVTFPWYKNEERSQDFIINSEALITSNTLFFHLKTTEFQWETPADLKNFKMGGTLGNGEEAFYKQHGIKADLVGTEIANYKKLLAGRIDAVPSDSIVGRKLLSEKFSPDRAAMVTMHPTPLFSGDMFLLISREMTDGETFAAQFDAALKQLKASGRHREIIDEAITN